MKIKAIQISCLAIIFIISCDSKGSGDGEGFLNFSEPSNNSYSYTYTFEDGDFEPGWVFDGYGLWTVTSSESSQGEYSAKSGSINHSQFSDLILIIQANPHSELVITFDKKTSTEDYYDLLEFFIDEELKGTWSGIEQEWSSEIISYDVGSSNNIELKWSYSKNGSIDQGNDCIYLDNIQVDY